MIIILIVLFKVKSTFFKWNIAVFFVSDLSMHLINYFFNSCALTIFNQIISTFPCNDISSLLSWHMSWCESSKRQRSNNSLNSWWTNSSPPFFPHSGSRFTWMYITIGKKRQLQIPFYANLNNNNTSLTQPFTTTTKAFISKWDVKLWRGTDIS